MKNKKEYIQIMSHQGRPMHFLPVLGERISKRYCEQNSRKP